MLLNLVEVFGCKKILVYKNSRREINLISISPVALLDDYASDNPFTEVVNDQPGNPMNIPLLFRMEICYWIKKVTGSFIGQTPIDLWLIFYLFCLFLYKDQR